MIPEIDRQLKQWITDVVGDVTISLHPPADTPPHGDAPSREGAPEGRGVSVYLLELADAPPASTPHVAPLQFKLRYLVTAWGEEPEWAHGVLGDLALAALDDAEMEVEMTPLSAEMWLALRAVPRPSFILQRLVRKPRPDPEVRLVTQPLVLHAGPSVPFVGYVWGPQDKPIVGAHVECAALNLSAVTDREGRFRFAAVPAGRPLRLLVRARRRQVQVTTDPAGEAEPFIIRMELKQERQ